VCVHTRVHACTYRSVVEVNTWVSNDLAKFVHSWITKLLVWVSLSNECFIYQHLCQQVMIIGILLYTVGLVCDITAWQEVRGK
jgi:hypothetical protein